MSTTQDEVTRLVLSAGDNDCATNNVSGYTGDMYTAGLDDLASTYACTGTLATYLIGGQSPAFPDPTYHEHIFRQEFYTADTNDGGVTMAGWTQNLLNGTAQILGP